MYRQTNNNPHTLIRHLISHQVSEAATQSEVGSASKHSGLAPSQRLKMLAIRRKKSQSLADLHDKSLTAASIIRPVPLAPPVTKLLTGQAKLSPGAEESGYDSDTRKSAETVSPKSSDKSDESDSGQDTSGSFTSENHKDSDTDPDTEPHYQVSRVVFYKKKRINLLDVCCVLLGFSAQSLSQFLH